MGVGDKVIRRNSLTTLHTLPTGPQMERQKTVPHGFNVSVVYVTFIGQVNY